MADSHLGPASTTPNRVTIRMYDMGFGDCFLILFPSDKGKEPKKVLIDCGSAALGRNKVGDVVKSVISAVRESDGVPRIDVVVCTHRHKDHLSGFNHPAWSQVEVGEVWMPWTESIEDEEATKLRMAQTNFAMRLTSMVQNDPKLRASDDGAASSELASLAIANEDAMNTLWYGFSPININGKQRPTKRIFLERSEGKWNAGSKTLAGVDVHVLGPGRDPEIIKSLEPPSEQAFATSGGFATSNEDVFQQFKVSRFRTKSVYQPLRAEFSKSFQKKVESAASSPGLLHLTRAFDNAINGTSLMLFFEYKKACLLFAGDAQWGTWEQILASDFHRQLIKKTDLYKVSHHGSHNGTPVEFVKKILPKSSKALISVGKHLRWPGIPKTDLLDALKKATNKKVVRSDTGPKAGTWHETVEERIDNAKVVYQEIKIVC